MLAIADRDRAEEWTELALRVVTRSADPRTQRWAGSLHNNAGWARHDAGDYAAALDRIRGRPDRLRRARDRRTGPGGPLGRRPGAAVPGPIRRGPADPAPACPTDPADGYVEEELAELLLATGRPDEAPARQRPPSNCSAPTAWFAEYESGRLERLRRLGQPD